MRMISIEGLSDKGIPYSKSQIYRKVREGSFPRPVKLGAHRVAFVEHEIDTWLEDRVADRDRPKA